MKLKLSIIILLTFFSLHSNAQNKRIDNEKLNEDLNEIIFNLSNYYVYKEDKKVDMECIRAVYQKKIDSVKSNVDQVLLFEYLLDEFYDSHTTLNTNVNQSYRLSSPIYVTLDQEKVIIKNVWQSQIESNIPSIINAEVIKFNNIPFGQKIAQFPTQCNDKSDKEVKTWVSNKIIAGKYNEPRILTLKLANGKVIEFDLDTITLKKNEGLLSSTIVKKIGIMSINNSLGNNQLISAFDSELEKLMDTEGLIIDLRNTPSGGNTYVAKGIMSRFINQSLPYQKHESFDEVYDNQPAVGRSWVEYVTPRGQQYKKPVIILVNRWTGSMGEGLAIGFDGMKRAEIVGTEMKRLAGSDVDARFRNLSFGYKLITQKLFHIDGTPRELFIPVNYINQTNSIEDQYLKAALKIIKKR